MKKGDINLYKTTKKINDSTKNFLYSKKIIILVFIFLFTTSLIPFILSLLNEKVGWDFYLLSVVAFVSSLGGLYGDIFIHRNDKRCFYFYFFYIFIYLINVVFNRLWYETIEQIIILILVTVSYFNWGKPKKEDKINTMTWKLFFVYSLIFFIISILLGSLMMFYLNGFLGDNKDPYPFLDAFTAVTFIGGWVLMSKKYIHAYIIYIISNVFIIILSILFIIDGSYYYLIYLITNLFYLGLYVIGSSNWTQIYYEENKKQ